MLLNFEFDCGIMVTTDTGREVVITQVGVEDGDAYAVTDCEELLHNDAAFLECIRQLVVESMVDGSYNAARAQAAADDIVYNAPEFQRPGRVSFIAELMQDTISAYIDSHQSE